MKQTSRGFFVPATIVLLMLFLLPACSTDTEDSAAQPTDMEQPQYPSPPNSFTAAMLPADGRIIEYMAEYEKGAMSVMVIESDMALSQLVTFYETTLDSGGTAREPEPETWEYAGTYESGEDIVKIDIGESGNGSRRIEVQFGSGYLQ